MQVGEDPVGLPKPRVRIGRYWDLVGNPKEAAVFGPELERRYSLGGEFSCRYAEMPIEDPLEDEVDDECLERIGVAPRSS